MKKVILLVALLLAIALVGCRQATPVYSMLQNRAVVYYTTVYGDQWSKNISLHVEYTQPGNYTENFSLGPDEPQKYALRDRKLLPSQRLFTAKAGSSEDVVFQVDWPVALSITIITANGSRQTVETGPYAVE